MPERAEPFTTVVDGETWQIDPIPGEAACDAEDCLRAADWEARALDEYGLYIQCLCTTHMAAWSGREDLDDA